MLNKKKEKEELIRSIEERYQQLLVVEKEIAPYEGTEVSVGTPGSLKELTINELDRMLRDVERRLERARDALERYKSSLAGRIENNLRSLEDLRTAFRSMVSEDLGHALVQWQETAQEVQELLEALNRRLEIAGREPKGWQWDLGWWKQQVALPSNKEAIQKALVWRSLENCGALDAQESEIDSWMRKQVVILTYQRLDDIYREVFLRRASTGSSVNIFQIPINILFDLELSYEDMVEAEAGTPEQIETMIALFGDGEYDTLRKALRAAQELEK